MKALQHLNKYLFKYKFRILLGTLFIVISNVFALYPAQIIREAFNLVEAKISGQTITSDSFIASMFEGLSFPKVIMAFGLIVFALAILKGIFTFFMRQTIIIMSRLVEYDLKNEIFDHYQQMNISFYKEHNTGDIMNRISEDVSKVRMYLGPGIMYTINLITLFILVVSVMYSINPKLTLYSLTPLPILSLIIYYVSNRINKQSEKVQRQLSDITTHSQETYSGIKIVKSFSREAIFQDKLNEKNEQYRFLSMQLVKTNSFFHPTMLLLIGLSTIFTIYVGGLEYIEGNITLGNILEFIFYINMLTWPVTALGWVTSIIQRAAASQERINQFLSIKPEIKNPSSQPLNLVGDVEFKNVSFVYPESQIQALKNISFHLKKGEKLGVIGKTGSGKSALADLLLRNYDANEGTVLIDQKNINAINLEEFRENIGYVPQEVFLFSDTITNNIAFGYKNELPSTERIHEAAKNAAIFDNIMTFDKNFDTHIGERGVTLSGGQKQRISIARAIIKSPKILVLDDCLSAVDTETEDTILSNLNRIMEDKTAIIISHRISSVKNADRIIVLDQGEIVEEGTHEDLLNTNGIYHRTYHQQLLETKK